MFLDALFSRQVTDTKTRSVVKTLSWRLIAACDTFVISLMITGKVASAATIIGIEGLTKILWFYLHERGWEHISWGRYKPTFVEHISGLINGSNKSKSK